MSSTPQNNNAVQAFIDYITGKNTTVTLPTIPTGDPSVVQAPPTFPVLQDIQGFVDSMAAAPTGTPKNFWGATPPH